MEAFISRNYNTIFLVLLLIGLSLAFYLGTLQGAQKGESVTLACTPDVLEKLSIPLNALSSDPVSKDNPIPTASSFTASATPIASGGEFMGSKNGTKYYTPGCAAANRIKQENIIWFQNEDDARLQGYTPAKC